MASVLRLLISDHFLFTNTTNTFCYPPLLYCHIINVILICSGIPPDLGEEFKGYLRKVRKVNGPLPLWLRQKIVSYQLCNVCEC